MPTNPETSRFVSQSLTTVYNYLHTSRPNKAMEILTTVKKVDPENPLVDQFFQLIAAHQGLGESPDLSREFGVYWLGQDLNGKSIEVICDQGMGDVINMLRYLAEMKQKWNCKIVVNCYAYFNQLRRLMEKVPYVDHFVQFHEPCDYHTNIFSIPAILRGVHLDVYYPAHFEKIMEAGVPDQPRIAEWALLSEAGSKHLVGVAWQSNTANPLSLLKSIDTDIIQELESDNLILYSLDPAQKDAGFMRYHQLTDLMDTASVIASMDTVVSVDTVVLHLAGSMQKRTIGLVPYDADPRWGSGETTVWYPSVTLVRQKDPSDWRTPVLEVKKALECLPVLR